MTSASVTGQCAIMRQEVSPSQNETILSQYRTWHKDNSACQQRDTARMQPRQMYFNYPVIFMTDDAAVGGRGDTGPP